MKYNCSICGSFLKSKFFPSDQPYIDKKVCVKCINVANVYNNTFVNKLNKGLKERMSSEEESKIRLSYPALAEMKHLMATDENMPKLMESLAECDVLDIVRETLQTLNLVNYEEIVQHCYTIAVINSRIRASYEKN